MNFESADDNLKKAKELENNKEFFSASHFYKKALELFLKKGDSKQIKFCKNKIVEVNKNSISLGKDFKEISVEHKFTKEQTKQLNVFIENVIKDKNIEQILNDIGIRRSFMPIVKNVEDSAKKTMPVTYSIASLSAISDKGHLLKGGEDGQTHWFMKMYEISQKTILELYLLPVVNKIMQSKDKNTRLDLESLISYFKKRDIVKDNNFKIIKKGLEAFFDKNYISSLHILIPQFEAVFLDLSESCGIDIVALEQKLGIATRTKTLSDRHLSSEEFVKIWGEDFCQQIKFVLFEPLGYKLRHKIAHGEILEEECNFQNVVLIIYFFLVLLGRIKRK